MVPKNLRLIQGERCPQAVRTAERYLFVPLHYAVPVCSLSVYVN